MSKILDIVKSMSEKYYMRLDRVVIKCGTCGKMCDVTVDAVYRQHRRGNKQYRCRRCAGKQGQGMQQREEASIRTKRKWENPGYAGIITGKAMGRQIIKELESKIT